MCVCVQLNVCEALPKMEYICPGFECPGFQDPYLVGRTRDLYRGDTGLILRYRVVVAAANDTEGPKKSDTE